MPSKKTTRNNSTNNGVNRDVVLPVDEPNIDLKKANKLANVSSVNGRITKRKSIVAAPWRVCVDGDYIFAGVSSDDTFDEYDDTALVPLSRLIELFEIRSGSGDEYTEDDAKLDAQVVADIGLYSNTLLGWNKLIVDELAQELPADLTSTLSPTPADYTVIPRQAIVERFQAGLDRLLASADTPLPGSAEEVNALDSDRQETINKAIDAYRQTKEYVLDDIQRSERLAAKGTNLSSFRNLFE